MDEHEIIKRLDKLQYQVETLGQTIDYERYPVEALILSKNWGPIELEKAHDIFEDWDKKIEGGGEMNSGSFEDDFAKSLSVNYQGLKSIILAFHRNSQWTNVCEAYVDSFGKTPSVEFFEIAHRNR